MKPGQELREILKASSGLNDLGRAIVENELRHKLLSELRNLKRFHHITGYPDVDSDIYAALSGEMVNAARTGFVGATSEGRKLTIEEYQTMAFGITSRGLIDTRMPLYFVSRSLLSAINHTDLDVPAVDLKLPLPTMMFVFPEGAILNDSGEIHVVSLTVTDVVGIGSHRVTNLFLICKDKAGKHFVTGGWITHDQTRLDHVVQQQVLDEEGHRTETVQLLSSAVNAAVGVILAMTYRPDLLTKEIIHHWQHKDPSRRGNVAFWSPNIVGRDYQILGGHGNGTHASPRMHWRRGHFRNQACGVGRKDHRQVWLEPMLVAATHKEDRNEA